MIDIGTVLRHYKRKDVQEEMVLAAKDREVAVKYGDKGFGKRPDTLSYPRDILEFAKNRATSFHVSEEHWSNVYGLSPSLKRSELDELRKGWDLVIDIDCINWKISKIISWLVIRSLQDHDIKSITCKFSGNKGFHIGVPLKAFPKTIHDKEISDWFPDGPKRIATYLLHYISTKYIQEEGDELVFAGTYTFKIADLPDIVGKENLTITVCSKCGRPAKEQKQEFDFACSKCGHAEVGTAKMMTCPKCGSIMEKMEKTRAACECGSTETEQKFNTQEIVDIDTLLISSRHMYRMPYSLHEKSGLCSVPIDPESILRFEKRMANPDTLKMSKYRFLDDTGTVEGEASRLVLETFDHNPMIEEAKERKYDTDFETVTEAIPADFFPPCIHNILGGLEDGRKRAMFILINFLSNTGYEYDKIEEILDDWNEKNEEQLREVLLKGQLRYRRVQKEKVMPPNCNNKAYYQDLHVCTPDGFCPRIKNPVNYSVLKAKISQKKSGGRAKLTDEQKEMRRKYRESRVRSDNNTKGQGAPGQENQ